MGFNRVFEKPIYSKRTSCFSVLACSSEQPQARLGIVVAKRNVKLAVNRNRLKRLVRESFRQQQLHLRGLDLVVIIKKDFIFDQGRGVNLSGVFKMVGDKYSACCKG